MEFIDIKNRREDKNKEEVNSQPPSFLFAKDQTTIKRDIIKSDLSNFRKVFQFCDNCQNESIHIIDSVKVICIYCENGYNLVNQNVKK